MHNVTNSFIHLSFPPKAFFFYQFLIWQYTYYILFLLQQGYKRIFQHIEEILPCRFSGNVRSNRLVHKSPKSKTESGCDIFHFFGCQKKQNKGLRENLIENIQGKKAKEVWGMLLSPYISPCWHTIEGFGPKRALVILAKNETRQFSSKVLEFQQFAF